MNIFTTYFCWTTIDWSEFQPKTELAEAWCSVSYTRIGVFEALEEHRGSTP